MIVTGVNPVAGLPAVRASAPAMLGSVVGLEKAPLLLGSSLQAWFDVQDLSTMWQDTAKTIPASYGVAVAHQTCKARPASFYREQATAAQRPILGRHPKTGIRNLLTYTEQFNNAAWTKTNASVTPDSGTAPDGTYTADRLTATGSSVRHVVQTSGVASGYARVFSVYVKAETNSFVQIYFDVDTAPWANFDLTTGVVGTSGSNQTAAISSVGGGWYRCSVYTNSVSASNPVLSIVSSASVARAETNSLATSLIIWGAQLEATSVATAYQKVVSAYDVTESGVPSLNYLYCDGVDDGMVTPSLDLTVYNKIAVFAGLRKLSDAAAGIFLELSANSNVTNGTFEIAAPSSGATILFRSRGTGTQDAIASGYASPYTAVVAGIGNIPAPSVIVRVNGVQATPITTSQGTGNYSNNPLYFFRRGGASLPFSGRDYGCVLASGVPTDSQILAMERYFNSFVGAY